jgi:transcriptional regulator with XRE-family HTH domain
MDIRKRVGARIKELRLGLKLTQEKLAFKAEVDKTYLNEVENGKRNVSLINLGKIITALEVSFEKFFKGVA